MIVKLEEDLTLEELEVLIRYASLDDDVQNLKNLLYSATQKIKCSLDGQKCLLTASQIYYIESVDKHTFVYCNEKVYSCEMRLYQLLELLSLSGFVQVSKSCIINIHFLEHIKPLRNSRLEATLSSGDRITITRKYLPTIRAKLERRS